VSGKIINLVFHFSVWEKKTIKRVRRDGCRDLEEVGQWTWCYWWSGGGGLVKITFFVWRKFWCHWRWGVSEDGGEKGDGSER